jgi:hypothetical protein
MPWKKEWNNQELQNFYSSPNIIRMIKSRSRWRGHEACMGKMRNANRLLLGKLEGKRQLGRPLYIDRIQKCILKKQHAKDSVGMQTAFTWLMTESSGGLFKYSKEGSVRGREFPD